MPEQALYSVLLRGGQPFSVGFPANPILEHNGAMTVESLVLTSIEADQLRGLALAHGCTEGTVRRTPGQSEDQRVIREALLGFEGCSRSPEDFQMLEDRILNRHTYDAVVILNSSNGKITVNLAKGGEKFPWAVHDNKVIIGPPDGTFTSTGIPLNSLSWKTNKFWVVDALYDNGQACNLTPKQFEEAVTSAEMQQGICG